MRIGRNEGLGFGLGAQGYIFTMIWSVQVAGLRASSETVT